MTNTSIKPGILYIVATPIGNCEDISLRAIETLRSVDIILTEDTRHSKPFLTSLGIKKPLVSLHAHNEETKSATIIENLLAGKSYALISDAGTPLVSDPGFLLVKQARAEDIQVVPIPGPCALITALSAAGVPCDTFTFSGFLPAKSHARCQKLTELALLDHTLVFYESTHRIMTCLDDIAKIFGVDCQVVLAKELTKCFERFVSGTGMEIKSWLVLEEAHSYGEFVIIIPARPVKTKTSDTETFLSILLAELPLKQAVQIACQLTKSPKNEVYALALTLSKGNL